MDTEERIQIENNAFLDGRKEVLDILSGLLMTYNRNEKLVVRAGEATVEVRLSSLIASLLGEDAILGGRTMLLQRVFTNLSRGMTENKGAKISDIRIEIK